jgi:TonB family protein
MDWQDDEFEAFLRQFRPRRPKPLPAGRGRVFALAIAAVIVAAMVVPARFASKQQAANDSQSRPMTTAPAADNSAAGIGARDRPVIGNGTRLNSVPDVSATPPAATKSTAPVENAAAPANRRDVKQPGRPRSNRSVSTASGTATRRVTVGGAIAPPTKLVDVKPIYPDDAQAAGIAGVVIVRIVIGEPGFVIDTEVVRSIPELDQAAIDAVTLWQFEPTVLNGEPVEVEMNVVINFTLQQ